MILIFNEGLVGINENLQYLIIRSTVYDKELHHMIKFIFEFQQGEGISNQIFYETDYPDVKKVLFQYFSEYTQLTEFNHNDYNSYAHFVEVIKSKAYDGDLLIMSNYDKNFMNAYNNPDLLGKLIYETSSRILIIQINKK